jgi:hypothetical protein
MAYWLALNNYLSELAFPNYLWLAFNHSMAGLRLTIHGWPPPTIYGWLPLTIYAFSFSNSNHLYLTVVN